MKNFDYYLPARKAEAAEALKDRPGARLKAGGTDLLPLLKTGIAHAEAVVSLQGVEELRGISKADDSFEIGAMTSIADVASHEGLARQATAVAEAAAQTATPLVRNLATLGGNLCQRPRCWYFRHPEYPCTKKGGTTCFAAEGENKYHAIFRNLACNMVHPSNLAPALWAHDAEVLIDGPDGESRMDIAGFWIPPERDMRTEVALKPGQIVAGVRFKALAPGSGSWYLEVKEKSSFDWALTSCACRIDLDGDRVADVRIVLAAVAPVPFRHGGAEEILRGRPFSESQAWKAADAAIQGATPLRDNKYKVRMLRSTVAHSLMEAARRAQGGSK